MPRQGRGLTGDAALLMLLSFRTRPTIYLSVTSQADHDAPPPQNSPGLAQFRSHLKALRSSKPRHWQASRTLVADDKLTETLRRLSETVQDSPLAAEIREPLLASLLNWGQAPAVHERGSDPLKQLTGLPTTKALRALCVHFGLADLPNDPGAAPPWTTDQTDTFLRRHPNPFDLLLEVEGPSLLDLGAGDLSFVHELATQYLPHLREQGQVLTTHALDRIKPGSSLGTAYQATRDRLASLKTRPGLQFRYWGDQDMFALEGPNPRCALLPRYHLVTCWAPANPTFAYEPSRLSLGVIDRHLRETRGAYRPVQTHREPALEVLHEGRVLLFPEWKFEIRGPLALLDVIAHRGLLCVLGAVDSEVFWELLAQLVADSSLRPYEVLFTEQTLPDVFGRLYHDLRTLPPGQIQSLAELTELRCDIPSTVLSGEAGTFRFRDVLVRRGSTFPDMPASSTARHFPRLREETTPWFLVLLPER